MRKSMFMWLGCAAVVLGSLSIKAQADSFSMAAGMQTLGGPLCYSFGVITSGVGAYKLDDDGCFDQRYVMPLYWRNFYSAGTNRTVQVRGRVPSSSSLLACNLSVFNSNGALVSQATQTFPVTGANYGTVSLTVNNVLSTSTSFVTCTAIGSTSYLMKVDYTP